jgi:hypothetical protein
VLTTQALDPASAYTAAFAPIGHPAPLRTEPGGRLLLFMAINLVADQVALGRGANSARTTAYRYRLLDAREREILAYHWHPIGRSAVAYPHMHLSSRIGSIELGPGIGSVRLADMHLPTGPVALADVVRLLITEFSVVPRRSDWEAVLRENRDRPDVPD